MKMFKVACCTSGSYQWKFLLSLLATLLLPLLIPQVLALMAKVSLIIFKCQTSVILLVMYYISMHRILNMMKGKEEQLTLLLIFDKYFYLRLFSGNKSSMWIFGS